MLCAGSIVASRLLTRPPLPPPSPAAAGLTVAEYFRDVEGQDVLLFVDNIFRFTQANSEVSALLGRIPSAVGYQPTLATDLGGLQERITTTNKGSITSVQVRADCRWGRGGEGPLRRRESEVRRTHPGRQNTVGLKPVATGNTRMLWARPWSICWCCCLYDPLSCILMLPRALLMCRPCTCPPTI